MLHHRAKTIDASKAPCFKIARNPSCQSTLTHCQILRASVAFYSKQSRPTGFLSIKRFQTGKNTTVNVHFPYTNKIYITPHTQTKCILPSTGNVVFNILDSTWSTYITDVSHKFTKISENAHYFTNIYTHWAGPPPETGDGIRPLRQAFRSIPMGLL